MTDPIKITELTADTAPTSDDLVLVVNNPAGAPVWKKVALGNLVTKPHGLGNGVLKIAAGTMAIATAEVDYSSPSHNHGGIYQPADVDLDSLSVGIMGLVKGGGNDAGYSAALAGSDYENPLTFSGALSRSTNAISLVMIGLDADTTPTLDDLLIITNDPAGTPGLKKVTLGNLIKEGLAFPQIGVEQRFWNVIGDNYERAFLKWDSNVFRIGTEKGGSGTIRNMEVDANLDVPYIFTGLVGVSSYSDHQLLTTKECRGYLILVTAAKTITLPPVAVGALVTIHSTGANAIVIDPDDADRIILDGTALGDGVAITSASAAGNYVTLIGDSAAGWTVIGRSGTWT